MPIFEADEELTDKEMKRQQRALTDKMFRLESKKLWESLDDDTPTNGDCWENENDDDPQMQPV